MQKCGGNNESAFPECDRQDNCQDWGIYWYRRKALVARSYASKKPPVLEGKNI